MPIYSESDTVGGDLPLALGGGSGTVTGNLDASFDIFVDNYGMNLHITRDTPYRRETAQWRKEQIDQAPEAGEQTLSSWWIRSQMSLHGGAGVKYLDSVGEDANSPTRVRFDDSRGMDVWTPGEIKRLPDTAFDVATSGETWVFSTTVGSEHYLVYGSGSIVKAERAIAGTTLTYTITGMSGTIKSMCIDGTYYYVATSDGHVFSGPIDGSASGAAIWDFTSTADVTLGWAKQRLMAGIDNEVYELAGTGPTLPAVLYTHPATGWRWTDFCDAPDAVLGAGYSGLNSAIVAFALADGVGGAPELVPGASIADLPVGETVQSIYYYVGSRLAIGTSLGFRVGTFDSLYGSFSFGPLVECGPIVSWTGRGAFVYGGGIVDDEPALIRVDLGFEVDTGRYAYATDLRCPDIGQEGVVNTITVDHQGLLVFAVEDYGLVRETDLFVGRDAWLRTARIRMTTVEPKRFKRGRVRTEGSGIITISAITNLTAQETVYTEAADQDLEEFSLPSTRAEWLQVVFDLTGDAKLTSYQVLALPAQPRQRLFALPVQLFDAEKNRHGRPVGYPGRAKTILTYLEDLESSGEEVVVQSPVLGIDAVRCVI